MCLVVNGVVSLDKQLYTNKVNKCKKNQDVNRVKCYRKNKINHIEKINIKKSNHVNKLKSVLNALKDNTKKSF